MNRNINEIKGIIYRCGYTVAEIAKKIGIPQQILSRRINADTLRMFELKKILELLNYTIEYKPKKIEGSK